MKTFLNTRLLIPAIVIIAGIYFISNPTVPPESKTFWKYLTFFAVIIGTIRVWMLYKKNN